MKSRVDYIYTAAVWMFIGYHFGTNGWEWLPKLALTIAALTIIYDIWSPTIERNKSDVH